jgi:putative NADH-flavin reductase
MQLTIFGATGGTGKRLLDQAVAAGHDVTAVVRDPAKLPAGVRAVTTDLSSPDPATLGRAVEGADAVLSALGPRSSAEAEQRIVARGTRAIVEAMHAAGVRRLVAISASPVATLPSPGRPHPPRRDPGDGFLIGNVLAPVVKAVFRDMYADLAEMEDVIRESGLDWTVVRPPRLNDKPVNGYRTARGQNVPHGFSASRADVADLMLRVLEDPDTVGQPVGIAR